MTLLKGLFHVVIIILLSIVTQIGGVIYLISWISWRLFERKITSPWKMAALRLSIFFPLYFVLVFFVVPPVAKSFGRVRLPIFRAGGNVQPANFLTCLLNRNYVREELSTYTFKVAAVMNDRYPGTIVNYLDANFPFFDGFPLLPHLSHNDGKKLDVSFIYVDAYSGTMTDQVPSFIGYGVCEEPKAGEVNKPIECEGEGFSQYNFLRHITPQSNKKDFVFDHKRNRSMIIEFAACKGIGKIFIEPHLKTRMGLTSAKIRFQGCQAVRHDDHIHIQLK